MSSTSDGSTRRAIAWAVLGAFLLLEVGAVLHASQHSISDLPHGCEACTQLDSNGLLPSPGDASPVALRNNRVEKPEPVSAPQRPLARVSVRGPPLQRI